MTATPEISLVIPAHNEELNIEPLCARLRLVLADYNYEVIIVDDGSMDSTRNAIKKARLNHPELGMVALSRNFGHQAAIRAGLEHARGACVITLDADLEHPPEIIPDMIAKWRLGFEVIMSRRKPAAHLPFFKRVTGSFFYKLINWLSDVKIEHGSADFRLLDRKVVDVCRKLPETDIFWRGLIPWLGFRSDTIWYDQGQRTLGETKYNFGRMLRLSISGITSFSVRPLHLSLYLGGFMSFSAFIYLAYSLWVKIFTDHSISGWASLIASVLLIGGIQLLILGVSGIYIGKLFLQSKGRPAYIVHESFNSFSLHSTSDNTSL